MKTITTIVMLTLALVMGGCAALDMRDQDVTERIEMHAGSSWTLGSRPADAQEPEELKMARKKYVYEKEVFLTPKSFRVKDAPEVDLYVINQSLNCAPRDFDEEFDEEDTWPCRPIVDLSGAIPSPSPLMTECLWFSADSQVNMVGEVDGKFCLFVSIVERTKCDPDSQEKCCKWPTNINRDSLLVFLFNPWEGPGGAGAAIGGPYPQFHAVPAGVGTSSPNTQQER